MKAQETAFSSTANLPDSAFKIAMMAFCMFYPISDKINYEIHEVWVTQTLKAIYLFEFLENHEKTKPLLKAFIDYFERPTWQQYLKDLMPLTASAIRHGREAHTDIVLEKNEKLDSSVAFLEKLAVTESDELDENDFLTIRSRPFYKVNDGVYRIIFNLFLVEKIFKGVYFLLRDINETLPNNQRLKDIKSFYGDEFSEKILLYKVMEIIYQIKCVRYTGKQISELHIDGGPDYYLRRGKSILLLESKDFLIAAKKKGSFDFNVYEAEFERVLYFEETQTKTKAKAVLQLANNVRKVLKKEFEFDKDYYYKDVFIYPVLITHDLQYDTPGFNRLLDTWFQEELEMLEDEGLFVKRVRPLTVVNIDSLIYNQIGLTENKYLDEVLELYNQEIKTPEYSKFKTLAEKEQQFLLSERPFALFIDRYFHQQGFTKLPPIIEQVAPSLFKHDGDKESKGSS